MEVQSVTVGETNNGRSGKDIKGMCARVCRRSVFGHGLVTGGNKGERNIEIGCS